MASKFSKGYVFPTVGSLPLEPPSDELKPFFRRKFRTFFRSMKMATTGVVTKDDLRKQAESMAAQLPDEDKKRKVDHWMNDIYRKTFLFGRDRITEDEFVEENVRKAFSDPESRRNWIKEYVPILKDSFDPIDTNHNGVIDSEEWQALWDLMGVHDNIKSKWVFDAMDADKDGVVSLVEFQYAWMYFMLCSGPESPFSMWFGYLVD